MRPWVNFFLAILVLLACPCVFSTSQESRTAQAEVRLLYPINETVVGPSATFKAEVVTGEVEKLRLFIDGKPVGYMQRGSKYFYLTVNLSNFGEVLHYWNVSAYNASEERINATLNPRLGFFYVDLSPPYIKKVEPANNTALNVANVTFKTVVFDRGHKPSGVGKVRIWIDNALYEPINESGTYITSAILEEGLHEWAVETEDRVGNRISYAFRLIVDLSPPEVVLISPVNETVPSGQNVTFLVRATDEWGVSRVELYIDGVRVCLMEPSGEYYVASVAVSPGKHVWKVLAFDVAGNSAFSENGYFYMPPQIVRSITPDPLMILPAVALFATTVALLVYVKIRRPE